MKYLIPSVLDHPKYKWERYDFSFDFDKLWKFVKKKDKDWNYWWDWKNSELKREHVGLYDLELEYEWRKYLDIVWDDEFSWLWIWAHLRWVEWCYQYAGEVINDWAHWRWSAIYEDWSIYDWEWVSWKRNWWWVVWTTSWIRRDNELFDKAFWIFDEWFSDEWHYYSVKWNLLYEVTEIYPWMSLDIYEYKIRWSKLMVKCIDRISLRGSNPELVKEEGHYEFDPENEEDMKNKKASEEYDKKLRQRHEFKWYTPAKMYVIIRNVPHEKYRKILNKEIKNYEKFYKEMSKLCKKYWWEWEYDCSCLWHEYAVFWIEGNKNFDKEKEELLKRYDLWWEHACRWYDYIKQMRFIERCWTYDEDKFHDLLDVYLDCDLYQNLQFKVKDIMSCTWICKEELAKYIVEYKDIPIKKVAKELWVKEEDLKDEY